MVERVALLGVVERQPGDRLGGAVEQQLAGGELGRLEHRYSRTTRTSPSCTHWPSSQRISVTLPSSSTSTGISIFIDSRMTTVSPSETWSPTATSIFQTVPVMCASTSIAHREAGEYPARDDEGCWRSSPPATRRTGSGRPLDALARGLRRGRALGRRRRLRRRHRRGRARPRRPGRQPRAPARQGGQRDRRRRGGARRGAPRRAGARLRRRPRRLGGAAARAGRRGRGRPLRPRDRLVPPSGGRRLRDRAALRALGDPQPQRLRGRGADLRPARDAGRGAAGACSRSPPATGWRSG